VRNNFASAIGGTNRPLIKPVIAANFKIQSEIFLCSRLNFSCGCQRQRFCRAVFDDDFGIRPVGVIIARTIARRR